MSIKENKNEIICDCCGRIMKSCTSSLEAAIVQPFVLIPLLEVWLKYGYKISPRSVQWYCERCMSEFSMFMKNKKKEIENKKRD
jgi:hypothetical protein